MDAPTSFTTPMAFDISKLGQHLKRRLGVSRVFGTQINSFEVIALPTTLIWEG